MRGKERREGKRGEERGRGGKEWGGKQGERDMGGGGGDRCLQCNYTCMGISECSHLLIIIGLDSVCLFTYTSP